MSAVHLPCDRCGRSIPAEGDQGGAGFGLCDACLKDLTGDDQGAGPNRPSAATLAAAFAEAMATPLCHRRRSGRKTRRRRTKAVEGVHGCPSYSPVPSPHATIRPRFSLLLKTQRRSTFNV
jgi:hypothetical protein